MKDYELITGNFEASSTERWVRFDENISNDDIFCTTPKVNNDRVKKLKCLPCTKVSGQGGSKTKPRHSRENASDTVVQTLSEAHQAHSSMRAHDIQSE
jgi:hypothetical protein